MQYTTAEQKIPAFQDRLVKLRGDMSNTEFANMLGLSRQSVGFYINGDRVPDARTILQICQRCGVSADYLLGQSDIRNIDIDAKAASKYTGLSGEAVQLLHTWNQSPEKLSKPIGNDDEVKILTEQGKLVFVELFGMGMEDIRTSDYLSLINKIIVASSHRASELMDQYKTIVIANQQIMNKRPSGKDAEILVGRDNCQKLHRSGYHVLPASQALNMSWDNLFEILKEEITKSIIEDIISGNVSWKVDIEEGDEYSPFRTMLGVLKKAVDTYGPDFFTFEEETSD